MIGGNRVAARYAAIPVNRRLVELYTLSGILAFVAAVCFTAHDGSASAASYSGLELQVIVAVVLGGTSVNGGRGSVLGSILGVFLVAVLAEGLRAGGSVFWIQEQAAVQVQQPALRAAGGAPADRRLAQHPPGPFGRTARSTERCPVQGYASA